MSHETIIQQATGLIRLFTELEDAITCYVETQNPAYLCRFDEIQIHINVDWQRLQESVEQLDARRVRLSFESSGHKTNDKVTILLLMNSYLNASSSLLAKLRQNTTKGFNRVEFESSVSHALEPWDVFDYVRSFLKSAFLEFDWHTYTEAPPAQESGSSKESHMFISLLSQPQIDEIRNLGGSDFFDNALGKLSTQARSELIALLRHIGESNAVEASVLVAFGGAWIASKSLADAEAESLAVWACGVSMNSEHVLRKMQQGRLHQIVNKTDKGHLVIADFGDGLLLVVADESYDLIPKEEHYAH